MKKVIIIGASGSLASYVIKELQKQKDIQLTLFLRNKSRLNNSSLSNTSVVEGDVMDYSTLKDAIEGQDIVYVNLAGNLEALAMNIAKSMKETGVKKLLLLVQLAYMKPP